MMHGARVIILNFEPRKTLEVIQAERVTHFLAISTMMNYLLAVPDFTSFDLKSVRLVSYGGGPFAAATLHRAAQALANYEGRDYCIPDDVKKLVVPVLANRLIVSSKYSSPHRRSEEAETILAEILRNIEVPL